MNKPAADHVASASAAEADAVPRVAIILVCWNSWRHVIECLESVFRQDYPSYRVIVCDNGSHDDSLQRIAAWAEGSLLADVPSHPALRPLVDPPVPKPIPHATIEREEAEKAAPSVSSDTPLLLVRNGANLGFAGGCNVGLRCALANGETGFAWLLNHDTVARPDALAQLVGCACGDEGVGICGSTIACYDRPNIVQALGGGRYNPWNGFAKNIGEGVPVKEASARTQGQAPQYIHGASMLVSRALLETVGLMAEEYFLYFEELDWACRAKGRFRMGHATRSLIYHKEGAVIGTSAKKQLRSRLSDYYMLRNRFRINARFFPYALPTLYLWVPLMIASRVAHRQWDRLGDVVRAALFLPGSSVGDQR